MTKIYSKPPSSRQLQIGQEIRSALSEYFIKGEYYHPLLESVMITITEVRISPDLKHATVFILISNFEDKTLVLKFLKEAAPEIRKAMSGKLKLRFSPELRFALDETQEKAAKIESLFSALNKK